jgi:hypothetical protein
MLELGGLMIGERIYVDAFWRQNFIQSTKGLFDASI